MSWATAATVGRIHLRSAHNGWRRDVRFRVSFWISTVLVLGLTAAGTFWLTNQVSAWQMAGPAALQTHLWLTLVLAWVAIAILVVLGGLHHAFGSDEARLLLSLPVPAAAHFRIVYGLVLFEQAGAWFLLTLLTAGVAFVLTLGWPGLVWVWVLAAGVLAVAWLALVALMLFVRYVLPQPRRLLWPLLLGLAVLEGLVVLLNRNGELLEGSAATPSPSSVALVLLGIVGMGLGPLAGWCGRQYGWAFSVLESQGRAGRAFTAPGVRELASLLERRRTLAGALLMRAILEQNRHPLALLRLAVLPVYLLLFGLLRPRLLELGFSLSNAAAAAGAIMGTLILIEYGLAYALSGEGARLALYLTVPLRPATLQRAKLGVALLPILATGWLAMAVMGVGASTLELLAAGGATSLFLIGVTGFVIWAGAADIDTEALPNNNAELLLQEELPITPRRLQLLGIAFLLTAGIVYLLWWLPLAQVLPLFGILCGVMLWSGWRLGTAGLRSLLLGVGFFPG